MKATVLFISEKNPKWAFVKPASSVQNGLVIQGQGAWIEFAEAPAVGQECTLLKEHRIDNGFWVV